MKREERSGATINSSEAHFFFFFKPFIVLLALGRCATTSPPPLHSSGHKTQIPSDSGSSHSYINHSVIPLATRYIESIDFPPPSATALIARKPFATVTNRKWKNKPRVCFDWPQWRTLKLWSQHWRRGGLCFWPHKTCSVNPSTVRQTQKELVKAKITDRKNVTPQNKS